MDLFIYLSDLSCADMKVDL